MSTSFDSRGFLVLLRNPAQLVQAPLPRQALWLRQARRQGLAGRIVQGLAATDALEPPLADWLLAARIEAENADRQLRWEVRMVLRALAETDAPVVLLKGAAYALEDLPFAQGRLAADVDILVPAGALEAVEQALGRHGWVLDALAPYDEQYYRQWMHELPPLRHRGRGTVLDVHHTVLPPTARRHPDPALLWADSRPLRGLEQVRLLSPADTVLHKCAHLFHDGDFSGGLRELLDLDGLLAAYGELPGFWPGLPERARRLDLERPLYYGLRLVRRLLGTPVPAAVTTEMAAQIPPPPLGWLMDRLVTAALVPGHPDRRQPVRDFALWLLYLRSHWLRMPPLLLARHLSTKAWMRWRGEAKGNN
jgi:hypothetical protein